MDLTSIWPNWGSTGDKPADGKDYQAGDNPSADSVDYLWYNIRETFSKVETALSNKADDPHGNEDHSSNFATEGDTADTPSDINAAPDPHGNGAHSSTFAVDGDEQPPEQHGNGAHSSTFFDTVGTNLSASNNSISVVNSPVFTDITASNVVDAGSITCGNNVLIGQNVNNTRSSISNTFPSGTDTRLQLADGELILKIGNNNRLQISESGETKIRGQNGSVIAEITQGGDLNLAGTVNENAL